MRVLTQSVGSMALQRTRYSSSIQMWLSALASAFTALLGTQLSSASASRIALRAPIFKGCDGGDGIGGWVLPLTLTEPSGRVTEVRVAVDTLQANLKVASTLCSMCRNMTNVQYPGHISGPAFQIAPSNTLGHAAAAVTIGGALFEAFEFAGVVSAGPRFWQCENAGCSQSAPCYDTYHGVLGLGFPEAAKGGMASPMTQLTERHVGDGFALQLCAWLGHPEVTTSHVGHMWFGGWDSHYLEGAPSWEPLYSCTDVHDNNRWAECSPHTAWTPHSYGVRMSTDTDAVTVGGVPVAMPLSLSAQGSHVNSTRTADWTERVATIEPELDVTWLNADANVIALGTAIADAGWVSFPSGTTDDQLHLFWRGRGYAVPGAHVTPLGLGPTAGVRFRFKHGSEVFMHTSAIFGTFPNGLRQVAFDFGQGHGQTLLGGTMMVAQVLLLDHAERRVGFAKGKNCVADPQPGDGGYTTPDHVFGETSPPPPPALDSGGRVSDSGMPYGAVVVLLVVGVIVGVALVVAGARVKGYELRQVDQSLLSDDALTVQQDDSRSRRSGSIANPALSSGDGDAEAED